MTCCKHLNLDGGIPFLHEMTTNTRQEQISISFTLQSLPFANSAPANFYFLQHTNFNMNCQTTHATAKV
jgi:hypothetical protein